MSYRASNSNRPQASVRSDHMGIAVVQRVLPTSAILSNKRFNVPILVTPKDTFNEPGLDLMEKLGKGMKVVYKSRRTPTDSGYQAVAVYLRPYDECMRGEAKMVEIHPTFGYADSPEHGSIFFPVSAIEEYVINEPFMRRGHNLALCLRVGDPISFVAVHDESTRNKSAYAFERSLRFQF